MNLVVVLVILVYKIGPKMQSGRFQASITALNCIMFNLSALSFTLVWIYTDTSEIEKKLNLKKGIADN